MDALKKLPLPWIAIALLVLVLIFMVRRSGYTPPTGAVITMMDLQEFSAFSPEQKAKYVNNLESYQPRLSNAASTNSIATYQMLLNEVMTNAIPIMPTMPMPQMPTQPPTMLTQPPTMLTMPTQPPTMLTQPPTMQSM